MTSYITSIEVMVMHRTLIERYGGSPGLRDAGALESALFRPQSGYYADVIAEAAALFESLAMNQPFVDGNKRIAFACVDVFLRINGYRLRAKSLDVLHWMIGHLEKGTFRMDAIEPWLRKNAKKGSSR
jgi:death on curing protein